jgi:S-DNA-T family DNA segregation ATPase FtsK/SpoIIIE
MQNQKDSINFLKNNLTGDQLKSLAIMTVKLQALGCDGHFLPEVYEGPIVTLYKFVPENATRVNFVERLAPDMAIALGVEAVQVRRLPGESSIGIYIPNKDKKLFPFRNAVAEVYKVKDKMNIPLGLGIDNMGNFICEDLTTLPHLLIAGSTGGGKSTLLNSIIASLVYCVSSTKLKMVLLDPKQVEFNHFDTIPHLIWPIACSTTDILDQLTWLCDEVEKRLRTLANAKCQNIGQYNINNFRMPYYVIVIDELADPLQDQSKDPDDEDNKKTYGKRIEFALGKIAAKARATGIHIIGATQRPSVKVVEGNIKANFPARLSFRLPSEADSRTILNSSGAEQLLSQGDSLYLSPNSPAIRRIHAPFASLDDIRMAVEMGCQRGSEVE